ncbi:MAG: J domain-containing protein [Magnetospirillum sp.]|nr:J domain-containing protein [Magnetospirillum sp.]
MDSAACDAGETASAEAEASVIKHSYTIPCSAAFRDAVEALAARRRVNVGDIARSALLAFPAAVIAAHPDPGEPVPGDRETVILKSGPAQGRPWRRKPRLQVRMAPGYDVPFIRRALAIAVALDRGEFEVRIEPSGHSRGHPPEPAGDGRALETCREEIERMRAVISVLAFEPLPEGVNTRAEALHVLGFSPASRPDQRAVRARFRMLATIHHPDSLYGSHQRMSQLNRAMELLRD